MFMAQLQRLTSNMLLHGKAVFPKEQLKQQSMTLAKTRSWVGFPGNP